MIPTIELTVIDRGVVARRLVMLTKGAVMGTDCIIPEQFQPLRPLEAAYSLTFVQTAVVSPATIQQIAEHFPSAQKKLRNAAAIYTLQLAFRWAWTRHRR